MYLIIILLLWQYETATSMDDITKDLLTPLTEFEEACGYESCHKEVDEAINVHIVPHTHAELGYTNTFYGHYTGYDDINVRSKINMKNILDAVITELWGNERRKFTFADFPYFFHWWKNRDETVRRMVFQLLRQGRLFFVGGSWGMPDEATTSYHAIIDLFTYTLRKLNATFLECGRPLVSWQSDAYGHSREFASLMAQMRFDGHFINPISFDDELARMSAKTLEFVWRGSDDLDELTSLVDYVTRIEKIPNSMEFQRSVLRCPGPASDIFTHKLFDGYWSPPGFCFDGLCTDPPIVTSNSLFSNVEERVNQFMKVVKNRQAPNYRTRHIMVVMGRRSGYYDAKSWFQNIDKLIFLVNSKQVKLKDKMILYYSTPACYLRAVYNERLTLPNKQDDFLPYAYNKDSHTSGMFTSRPVTKHQAREIHRYVQMAKQLQVLARLQKMDQQYEDMMWVAGVLQDHNIITGAMKPQVVSYYHNKFVLGRKAASHVFKAALNKLRKSPAPTSYAICQFNVSSCAPLEGNWSYIILYNPLAWPVSMPVRLPVGRSEYVVYDHEGTVQDAVLMKLPEQVINLPDRYTTVQHDLVFFAKEIPPLGFKGYYIEVIKGKVARRKRSLIKKLNKNKSKKYITRQTNLKIDDKLLLDDELLEPDYEYFDETTTEAPKIVFGDVSRRSDAGDLNDDILTPPTKVVLATEAFNNVTIEDIGITTEFMKNVTDEVHEKTTSNVGAINSETVTTNSSTATAVEDDYEDVTTPETTTTQPTTTTHVNYQEYSRRMADNIYFSVLSSDTFIRNKYIQINLDSNRKVSNMILSNGVNISLNIDFLYYVSDEPEKFGSEKLSPGVYIFRPVDPNPEVISNKMVTEVFKTYLLEEIHIKYSDYASIALRIYQDMPTVELDWVVGPIPEDDGFGKDVFIRYTTDLNNKGVFYTDSNGRQTIKRIRDSRATYEPVNKDRIPSNYYPVTSKIYIEDVEKNTRLSIFNDRTQGGTSLSDGQIDLMLHRRLFTDDCGMQTFINETFAGKGLIVRGKHYIYLTKANYKPNKVFEKKLAKEIELGPFIFTSTHSSKSKTTFKGWFDLNNEFKGLNKKLPVGVHILTLEKWHDKLLLRLENYLEKDDVVKSGIKRVYIKDLFSTFNITDLTETYLGANILKNDLTALRWNTNKFHKSFNEAYGNLNGTAECSDDSVRKSEDVNIDDGIVLTPQQIRTFVIAYINK